MIDTNNGWIKCSDRLPEEGVTVLCVTEDLLMFMDHYYSDLGFAGDGITHWRPLPAPPAIEERS